MKKGLIFATTLAMALGVGVAVSAHQAETARVEADSTRDVYLNIVDTEDFLIGNERFAVYAFGGKTEKWYDMSQYAGSHFYKSTIDSDYQKVIFCRMNGSAAENIWTNKWDQTADLTLGNDTTYFKATAKTNGEIAGEWYDAAPSETTNFYYVFDKDEALGNTLANVNVYGFGAGNLVLPMVWPGTNGGITTTTEGGRTVYRVELSNSFTKMILNNGTVQTVDVNDAAEHVGDVLVIGAANDQGKYNVTWSEIGRAHV